MIPVRLIALATAAMFAVYVKSCIVSCLAISKQVLVVEMDRDAWQESSPSGAIIHERFPYILPLTRSRVISSKRSTRTLKFSY